MAERRVLAIWLDGYETTIAEQLMAQGELSALDRLHRESARARLDHGPAQRTGLAGEHLSTGLSPRDADRWAAVSFDPATYMVEQVGTTLTPFPALLDSRTVVFDMPYFDLQRAPQVRGLVNWGAHDAGVASAARPDGLLDEFHRRFGDYPAEEFIYGLPWPSPAECRRMGAALNTAVRVRTRATRWLLEQRFPDWELALVTVSEPHSAIEGLWHGLDSGHPLHHLSSALPAGEGLRSVYRAVDAMVGEMIDAFPDAAVIVFSMGGMGPNQSDVASMALLPELLYREAFGEPLLRARHEWTAATDGVPILEPGESWSRSILDLLPATQTRPGPTTPRRRSISSYLPAGARPAARRLRRMIPTPTRQPARPDGPVTFTLGWMPADLYQPHWHRMRAFALPSFYDGRIRINLIGREHHGMVEPGSYAAVCDETEAMLHECYDTRTGEGAIDHIERPAGDRDPRTMGPTESDLVVVWKGPLGLTHPRLGKIGPLPIRRTGGHTGPHGILYIHGVSSAGRDLGDRSAFDVVPTIVGLLGESVSGLSGSSLLPTRPDQAVRT